MSDDPPTPQPTYQASEDLKNMQWPEENLALSSDEGGGFYPARIGEIFDEARFVITKKLGWGGFSSVWLARDRKDDRFVALKILSSHASREIEAGRLKERDILRKVSSAAPSHHGYQHVVHLLHEFEFESFAGRHICFVTDVLSYSVPNLLEELPDPRLPLKFILRITKHVLKGLEYLHDECKVVHSDLKPGNLLLLPSDIDTVVMHELVERPPTLYEFPKTVPPDELPFHPVVACPLLFDLPSNQDTRLHWVIADLGHAHLQDEHLSNIIQPYALRAPEVILGLEWGPAVDIWSLGCMMYEFATGTWLFTPEATDGLSRDVVHLAQMTLRTGQEHNESVLKKYEGQRKLYGLRDMLKRATAITESIGFGCIESRINESSVYNNSAEEVSVFIRLIRTFLVFDPKERLSAKEALRDPVFEHI
ncbi:kinase-like protein, partial [Fomitiporia mediterranea MF3/22]|uniref:kinase-like protein n=1 Tax=Fomitiporia mediterranea (strain MF3/22) TaxID=694068 RepID=UPI00044073DE